MSSTTASAASTARYMVEVCICGLPDILPNQDPNDDKAGGVLGTRIPPKEGVRKSEEDVLRHFNADVMNYSLLWPPNTESCRIHRPFFDLFVAANAARLQGKIICFHFHRTSKTNDVPVMSTKVAKLISKREAKPDSDRSDAGREQSNVDWTSDDETGDAGDGGASGGVGVADDQDSTDGSTVYLGRTEAAQTGATTLSDTPPQPGPDLVRTAPPAIDSTASAEASAESDVPNAAPKTATVTINWSTDPKALLASVRPEHTTYKTAVTTTLGELQATIRQAIIDRLRQNQQDQPSLRPEEQVRFRTTIGRGVCGSRLLDIDDLSYGGRLSTVADFFDDPDSASGRLRAQVTLIVEPAQASSSPSKKQKTAKASVVPIDFDAAVHTFHDTTSHEFLRLGDSKKRKQERPTDIAVEFPLIAETDPPNQELVQLWQTDGWDFGDSCIGGFVLSKKPVGFLRAYDWWDGYRGVQSRRQLEGRVFQPVGGDPRFPVLPPLTLNVFDPASTTPALGVTTLGCEVEEREGEKIFNVAIRFVSHLTGPASRDLEFPDNMQVELEDADQQDDVLEAMYADLRDQTPELYSRAWQGRWSTELWAMPQQPGLQKLFRFPTTRTGSSGRVTEFVNQQMLDEGHRKLYMEAHVWPVGSAGPPLKQSTSTRSGRLNSTGDDALDESSAFLGASNEKSTERSDTNRHAEQVDGEGGDRFNDEEGDEQLEHKLDADTQRAMERSRKTAEKEAFKRAIDQSLLENNPEIQQALDRSQHEEWLRNAISNVDAERRRLGLATAGQEQGLGEEDFAADLPVEDFD